MIERKWIVGVITILIGIVSYFFYIRDMFHGKTRPHIFSRILRWVGAWIVFAGQWSDGAGAWSWSNFLTGFICLGIAVYAYFHHGISYITKIDIAFFLLAFVALVVYFLTNTRLRSIIIINLGDILSLIPSIRKSWNKPYEETISMYALSSIKFILMIAATASYSFVTVSNSILRALLNAWFVMILYVRRRQSISHWPTT